MAQPRRPPLLQLGPPLTSGRGDQSQRSPYVQSSSSSSHNRMDSESSPFRGESSMIHNPLSTTQLFNDVDECLCVNSASGNLIKANYPTTRDSAGLIRKSFETQKPYHTRVPSPAQTKHQRMISGGNGPSLQGAILNQQLIYVGSNNIAMRKGNRPRGCSKQLKSVDALHEVIKLQEDHATDNQTLQKLQLNSTQPMSSQGTLDSRSYTAKNPLILTQNIKKSSGSSNKSRHYHHKYTKTQGSQDFKQAYRQLQEDLKNKHQILLGCSSLQQFMKKKESLSGTMTSNYSKRASAVHEKLYKEKLTGKDSNQCVNSKQVEDAKQCTFTPNDRKSASRSFTQLYKDILSAHKKSEERLNKLRQESLFAQSVKSFVTNTQQEQMSKTLDMRKTFRQINERGSSGKYHSKNICEKLYQEGIEKQLKMSQEGSQPSLQYSFKPDITKQSRILASSRYTTKDKENHQPEQPLNIASRRQSEILIEQLHSEKLKKSKSRTRYSQDFTLSMKKQSITDNTQTMRCLETRLDKILNGALLALEYEPNEGIDQENLFIILKYLGYATLKDEEFIKNTVHLMLKNGMHITWEDLKLLVSGIEGIYLENHCKNRYVSIDGQSQRVRLDRRENFEKFHSSLQKLYINKCNHKEEQRLKQIAELRNKYDNEGGITHHPRLNRKSVQIDQEVSKERSNSGGKPSNQQRVQVLFEKGQEYQILRKIKAEEKVKQEISECTFKPQVKTKVNGPKRQGSDLHQLLYEESKRLSKDRKDKTTAEVEFERSVKECTFKPNLEKPDILKLSQKLPKALISPPEKRHSQSFKQSKKPKQQDPKRSSFNDTASSSAKHQLLISPQTTTTQKCLSPPDTNSQSRSSQTFTLLQQHVNRLTDQLTIQRKHESSILRKNLLITEQPNDQEEDQLNVSDPITADNIHLQPILFLEVNIGGDRPPAKLLLYEGDSAEDVVGVFAQVYSLTESKKEKLKRIVREQVARVLVQIGEQEDEEECV